MNPRSLFAISEELMSWLQTVEKDDARTGLPAWATDLTAETLNLGTLLEKSCFNENLI